MWSRSGADESKRRAAIPAVTLSGGERDPRGQRRILLVPGPGLSRGLAQRRQPSRESRPRDPQRGGSPRLDLLRGDRERRDGAGRAGIAQDPAVELPLGSVDPRVGPQDRCQRRERLAVAGHQAARYRLAAGPAELGGEIGQRLLGGPPELLLGVPDEGLGPVQRELLAPWS